MKKRYHAENDAGWWICLMIAAQNIRRIQLAKGAHTIGDKRNHSWDDIGWFILLMVALENASQFQLVKGAHAVRDRRNHLWDDAGWLIDDGWKDDKWLKEGRLRSNSLHSYRDGLENFSRRYPWQWFCSMNLDTPNINHAERLLKHWRIYLSINASMRISYMGVLNHEPHPHIHLLALGIDKYKCTLRDVDPIAAVKLWGALTQRSAVIKPIRDYWDMMGYVLYICKKNTPQNCFSPMHEQRFELIRPYGLRLLKKSRSMKRFYFNGKNREFDRILNVQFLRCFQMDDRVNWY